MGETLIQDIALQSDGDGRVHTVITGVPEQAGRFRDMGYHIMTLPNQTVTIVMQNDNPDSPLYNPLVRQAISMAIDRVAITESLGFGVHQPALQYVPPPFRGHIHDPNFGAPAYNPDRARELMAEAGFPNGFSTTLYPAPGGFGVSDSAAVAIQHMLAEIGIDAELVFMEGTPFTEMRRETGWEGILIGHFISWFHAEDSAGVNFEHIEGAVPNFASLIPTDEMQALIEATRIVGDNTEQAQALARYVLDHDNLHVIPLWFQGMFRINHPTVRGWSPADHMNFWEHMWLADD